MQYVFNYLDENFGFFYSWNIIDLKPAFVYQGKECRNDANCLINAVCNSQQCTCKANYTVINGLCCK